MSKAKGKDELRAEYDLSKMGPWTVGKYFRQAVAGNTVVVLDDDVAEVFPYANAVNRALRLLIEIGVEKPAVTKRSARRTTKRQAAALGASAKRRSARGSKGSKNPVNG